MNDISITLYLRCAFAKIHIETALNSLSLQCRSGLRFKAKAILVVGDFAFPIAFSCPAIDVLLILNLLLH